VFTQVPETGGANANHLVDRTAGATDRRRSGLSLRALATALATRGPGFVVITRDARPRPSVPKGPPLLPRRAFAVRHDSIGEKNSAAAAVTRPSAPFSIDQSVSRIAPAALGSKPNKAWSSTSAFGPIPDIGHAEQFVRDGPRTDFASANDAVRGPAVESVN
jgi:hypothetical protein